MTKSERYLLDTNTINYLLSHRSEEVRRCMRALPGNASVLLSSVCEAEILSGLQQRNADRLLREFHRFATTVDRGSWDASAASHYAKLNAYLSQQGLSLSLMDKLIAAHSLSTDAILVTHDRALHRVAPYLAFEDWATDIE